MNATFPDRIILEHMEFYAYHGRNPEERILGQPFVVDLEVYLELEMAGTSDDIKATVSYSDLYRLVKEEMERPSRSLLEAVAQSIAERILALSPVQGVKVKVKKTKPPIKGALLSGAAIQIYRTRSQDIPSL